MRKALVQHFGDRLRIGIEIERGAHAPDHERQHLAERFAHAQQQLRSLVIEGRFDPGPCV